MPKDKDQFSFAEIPAAISAALRIPLTDLFTHINLIISSQPEITPELRAQLESLLRDAYRLLRAAGSMTLAGTYPSHVPLLAPLSLWEELSSCVHAASILLPGGGQQLEYEFPATGESVNGDVTALSVALLHLISNALEASPANSTVLVKGTVVHDKAVISVSDQGRGIPPDHIGKIFEPYYSRNAQGLPYQSIGLGLSLAQKVFEAHGGSIQVTSDDEGTKVICSLPLLPDTGTLPLRSDSPLYLEDRFSPVYTVLCDFIPPPWPY